MAVLLGKDVSVGTGTGLAADLAIRPDAVVSGRAAAVDVSLSVDFAAAARVPGLLRPTGGAFSWPASERLPAGAGLVRAAWLFFATEGLVFAVFFIALAMRLKPNESIADQLLCTTGPHPLRPLLQPMLQAFTGVITWALSYPEHSPHFRRCPANTA